MRRTTSALVNAGLVLASLGAGVFLAEGFVRLLAPQQLIMDNARIWRPDPLLGWTHREGVDVTINTGEQPARFVTDAQGFRIPAPRPEPRDTAGRPRLLILGDSFTEGLMVDAESTFAGQLERALAARGLRVTIFNAGVGGWGPVQYALRARQLGDQPFAAVLVCLFVGNDVLTPADTALHPTSFGRRARLRWPRAPADVTDAWVRPLNDVLEQRSHLFVFTRVRSAELLARLGLTPYYFPDLFLRATARDPRWALTADVALRVREPFADDGTPVLYVLLPTVYQVHPDAIEAYLRMFEIAPETVDLDQPQRLLGAALRARGAQIVDVLPALRAARQHRLFGQYDQHLNAHGHRRVADALTSAIEALLHARPDTTSPAG